MLSFKTSALGSFTLSSKTSPAALSFIMAALSYQADKDGNEKIDFSEFSKLWIAIRGEGEVELIKYFW